MNSLKVTALITLLAAVAACSTSTPAPSAPPIEPPNAEAPADAEPAEARPAEASAGADGQGDIALFEAPDPASAPASGLTIESDSNDPPSPPSDVAAAPDDAIKTVVKHGGGRFTLESKVISAGKGRVKPGDSDIVEVHYTGWTTDGNMFDSSIMRGQTIKFPLDGVIPGWREAVKLMLVGEKRRVWIPEELAYKGVPGTPQGPLVFEIELFSIVQMPKIDTPKDVAAPPKSAQKTKLKDPEGKDAYIYSRVLTRGTGKDKPTDASMVRVHYSGWTTDGKMFDSSVKRGQPIILPLEHLIPGWREAVKLMVVGEKRRVWIPEELAYKDGPPGVPKGMLVFEIELLEIMSTSFADDSEAVDEP